MLTSLELKNFKNFRHANLDLGPFTVLVGTNASGKSNLRDAFRFLHGIGRGYSLAEIIGQKWGDEGVLQWRGIRGGVRETVYHGENRFALSVQVPTPRGGRGDQGITVRYSIEVENSAHDKSLHIADESLTVVPAGRLFYCRQHIDQQHLKVRFHRGSRPGRYPPTETLISSIPLLWQIATSKRGDLRQVQWYCRYVLEQLQSFRFLDLNPDAMRIPSLPGQNVLGDRGENLSSVLYAICSDEKGRRSVIEWVKELTPMDASDFQFPADQAGRVLLSLVENGGRATSALSASDGTLRFLAMTAALLGPEPAGHYFFEELDNGIHPTRLALLVQLIERRVAAGGIQMLATTHSPQLLGLLNSTSLEAAALTYRLPGAADAHIKRIMDIPDAAAVIRQQNLARLHASGWLEDAVAFAEEEVPS